MIRFDVVCCNINDSRGTPISSVPPAAVWSIVPAADLALANSSSLSMSALERTPGVDLARSEYSLSLAFSPGTTVNAVSSKPDNSRARCSSDISSRVKEKGRGVAASFAASKKLENSIASSSLSPNSSCKYCLPISILLPPV